MADGAGALEAFRNEVRTWLEANCPPAMRTPMPEDEVVWGGRNGVFKRPEAKQWLEAMGAKGWTAPTWPKEYGGGGLSAAENAILQDELRRIKARPPLFSFGLWMFGPVLLEYGNEAQKKEHLSKIVRGEIRWCQGYSEPGAGSDLAGLQTRCEDKGDHYLINGQKVWTSYANEADWMFCLVRTDTTTKHEGISFVLFDMKTPGVETRPIKLISGSSPFCETFLTDVKVPKENLVGRLNGGWDIAKRLLMYERQNISASGFGGAGGLTLDEIAKTYVGLEDGKLADTDLRARIAEQMMADKAFGLTVRRATEMAKSGEGVGHMASMFKVAAATLNQKKTELMLEALGNRGLGWSGDGFAKNELKVTRDWLRAKGNSIEGGTTEVNLNVIAKRVLGLRDHQ
ncbi:MAG: acyl-CoA dehydrogenase family protein [Alphaproteobacteria bacterium]|nr:acyl-CoA dehydrogenase family protein [Alphaproteobacteria bacterium]